MQNDSKDSNSGEPININKTKVVERKPGMNLQDLISKVRDKTQRMLAEKAKESNHS